MCPGKLRNENNRPRNVEFRDFHWILLLTAWRRADANHKLIACDGESLAAVSKLRRPGRGGANLRVAKLSSQDVAVGSASNEEGAETGTAGANEHVTVPLEVGERGVDGAAGDTDWDV